MDGDSAGLCGVLVLAVTALRDNAIPSVLLDHTDDISNLHSSAIPLPSVPAPPSLTRAAQPPRPARALACLCHSFMAAVGWSGQLGHRFAVTAERLVAALGVPTFHGSTPAGTWDSLVDQGSVTRAIG
jgi:hypothetical protein